MFILISLALFLTLPHQVHPGRRRSATAACLGWFCCPKLTNKSQENLAHQVAALDKSRIYMQSTSSLLSPATLLVRIRAVGHHFLFFEITFSLEVTSFLASLHLSSSPPLFGSLHSPFALTLSADHRRVPLQVNRDSICTLTGVHSAPEFGGAFTPIHSERTVQGNELWAI